MAQRRVNADHEAIQRLDPSDHAVLMPAYIGLALSTVRFMLIILLIHLVTAALTVTRVGVVTLAVFLTTWLLILQALVVMFVWQARKELLQISGTSFFDDDDMKKFTFPDYKKLPWRKRLLCIWSLTWLNLREKQLFVWSRWGNLRRTGTA